MNQEKIWEAFQSDESLSGLGFPARSRFVYIAKQIPKESLILNVGVGSGYLESILTQKGVDISCLDPSESAIDKIREQLKLGEQAQTGYSQDIPFPDASFDYVIMSEVLEHLDDQTIEGTFKEVKRILKSDGKFIGTVPADENLDKSIVVCPNCSEYFHRWGHMQSFSKERLTNILGNSFDDVTVQRKIFNDFGQLNWKGKAVAAAKQLQVMFDLKGSTQNLFFVCKT